MSILSVTQLSAFLWSPGHGIIHTARTWAHSWPLLEWINQLLLSKSWVSFYGNLALPFSQPGGVCTRLGFLSPPVLYPQTLHSHMSLMLLSKACHICTWHGAIKKHSGGLQHNPHNFRLQSAGVWGKSKHKTSNKCLWCLWVPEKAQGQALCNVDAASLMWVALSKTGTTHSLLHGQGMETSLWGG